MMNLLVNASSYEGVNRFVIVLQSLYDLVPVTLFLIASIVLMKSLYNKMVKGAYVLFSGGSIMVFVAGLLKAMHKCFIGLFQIDYVILDKQFTSTQSIGFLLIFLGLLGMFTKYNKDYTKVRSSILPIIAIWPILAISEYTSSMPFVVMMVIGATGIMAMFIYMSLRLKNKKAMILYIVAFISMLAMGYLSTKADFSKAWIQISVNVIYQASYLLGAILLKKSGLDNEDCFYKE